MTPTQFNAWLQHMDLSERRAAELLGVAAGTVGDWRRGTSRSTGKPINPPPLLGLACAALAAGLREWAASE